MIELLMAHAVLSARAARARSQEALGMERLVEGYWDNVTSEAFNRTNSTKVGPNPFI